MFVKEKLIRFQHCDPAGIVFCPHYFVLFHEHASIKDLRPVPVPDELRAAMAHFMEP